MRRSQQDWLRVRGFLNAHRHQLGRATADLYPRSWRVAGTPLLARPGWVPATPVPLDQVTLSWRPGRAAPDIDGTGPETATVCPLRDDASRFGSYAAALGDLNRPGLFENRGCYRLLEVDTAPGVTDLRFGAGRYFEVINICEAAAHEYAAATLARDDPGRPPAMDELPLRSLIGDPTDLERRPVLAAICTLVLRADRASGDAAMILHWRDPARVASGGGLYQVAPVGVFQPSHDAEWNQANDFSLWRGIVRELSEELLGGGEDYHSDTAPIDYQRWPLHNELAAARRAGTLRVFWLGLGADPLTLATDLLTVAVLDAGLFDATFAGLVRANDEGRIVTGDGAARAAVGTPFRAVTIERFTAAEPMQPPAPRCCGSHGSTGTRCSRAERDNTGMEQEPRVFTSWRAVHGTDVSLDGRLRLDALARYLQAAAEGDLAGAGWRSTYDWVVRRCAVRIDGWPRLSQRLQVRTFCSAIGPRWAERTTTLAAGDAELVRATAVWAAIDRASGRPCPLGEEFNRVYGPSAAGRTVSVRLSHPRPPEPAAGDPWPLRAADFDASGHVNNAVYWAAVEDTLAALGWLPGRAEIEYHRPALPGCEPRLLSSPAPHGAWAWLLNGGRPLASARLAR